MSQPSNHKLILSKGTASSQEFQLTRSEIVIGRDSGVDVIIPSSAVSRRHARLVRDGEGYMLEDMGSSNGTYLNGERLAGGRTAPPEVWGPDPARGCGHPYLRGPALSQRGDRGALRCSNRLQWVADCGWTYVDKENGPAYWGKIILTWLVQSAIIMILFAAILFLQKRKDVT